MQPGNLVSCNVMQCDAMRCGPLEVIFQHIASMVGDLFHCPGLFTRECLLREQDCVPTRYFAAGWLEAPIRGAEPCGQKSGLGPEGARDTVAHNGGGPGSDWRQSLDTEVGH